MGQLGFVDGQPVVGEEVKLAPGMTVQVDQRGHYAFCVRCWWQSPWSDYDKARKLAGDTRSHCCKRPQP